MKLGGAQAGFIAIALAGAILLGLNFWLLVKQEPAPSTSQTSSTPQPHQPTPSPEPLACDGVALAQPAPDLAETLTTIAEEQGVQFEAAWHDPSTGIQTAGELPDAPAWSTIKVPLAVAVSQAGLGEHYAGEISSALRVSDNESALQLWRALGSTNAERAEVVTGVLAQSGDQTTVVPSAPQQAGYSIFGQTVWSSSQQVSFALELPCLAGTEQVLADLANITPHQTWGLGRLPEAVFKGGWGPGPDGYLVRQFGWFSTAEGTRMTIAIAVRAASFEHGVAALEPMAASLG